MPANDSEQTITRLTPERAIDVLELMIGQLEIVRDHFADQKNISASTRAKTLADMNDQHEALKMGQLALKALRETKIRC